MKHTARILIVLMAGTLLCACLSGCKAGNETIESPPAPISRPSSAMPTETIKNLEGPCLLLAKQYQAQGEKSKALATIAEAIALVPENNPLYDEWWSILLDPPQEQQTLTSAEMLRIERAAYLIDWTESFFSSSSLTSHELAYMLHVYYDSILSPEDCFYSAEYYEDHFQCGSVFVISAQTVNAFVYDVVGIDCFGIKLSTKDGDVSFKDGTYYCLEGDYQGVQKFVRSYTYLGDDLFHVIFDGFLIGVPDGDEDLNKEDCMRLIVKRTQTPFGFTIISKIKGDCRNDSAQGLYTVDAVEALAKLPAVEVVEREPIDVKMYWFE